MRLISFDPDAFQQFSIWATDDKKLFERLKRIISETAREPFVGIGKPETVAREPTWLLVPKNQR